MSNPFSATSTAMVVALMISNVYCFLSMPDRFMAFSLGCACTFSVVYIGAFFVWRSAKRRLQDLGRQLRDKEASE